MALLSGLDSLEEASTDGVQETEDLLRHVRGLEDIQLLLELLKWDCPPMVRAVILARVDAAMQKAYASATDKETCERLLVSLESLEGSSAGQEDIDQQLCAFSVAMISNSARADLSSSQSTWFDKLGKRAQKRIQTQYLSDKVAAVREFYVAAERLRDGITGGQAAAEKVRGAISIQFSPDPRLRALTSFVMGDLVFAEADKATYWGHAFELAVEQWKDPGCIDLAERVLDAMGCLEVFPREKHNEHYRALKKAKATAAFDLAYQARDRKAAEAALANLEPLLTEEERRSKEMMLAFTSMTTDEK